LIAADRPEGAGRWSAVWRHWYPGDLPASVRPGLRDLGLVDGGQTPTSHGLAQGLLGWLLEQERKA
jgi:hypothetical protein